MEWLKLDKKYSFAFLVLSLLSLLYVFPIVLANVDYKDDLGSSITGVIGLKGDGRPLGEYLVAVLCGGEPFTNIAPLSLIISVLFLSYALILYAKTNLHFVSNNYILIPVLLSVVTNPLAVECLSYRSVSVAIVIALAIPFLMFTIPDTVSNLCLFIYSAILCMAVMGLYQAAIGLCLVLFAVDVFLAVFGEKELHCLREGVRLAGIGISAVFYKVIVAEHFVDRNDWRHEASQIVDLKFSSVAIIIKNIADSCRYLSTFFSMTPIWYRIALAATILFAITIILILYCQENCCKGWKKPVAIIFLAISPVVVYFATFLPLMVLRTLMLKTRLFLALGGVLFYVGIFLLYYYRKRQKIFVSVFLIICIFYSYIYIYNYGNAIASQQEYAKYLVYNIAHDVETLNAEGDFTKLSFVGRMPRNRRIQIMYEKYPIYQEIIPKYFTNDSWMGGAWVLQYLQGGLTIESDNDADRQIIDSTEPIMKNSVYSCYVNADKIIVCFQQEDTQ